MDLAATRAPIDDRRLHHRAGGEPRARVSWLDPEGAVAGVWANFSMDGALVELLSGERWESVEPGSLMRGWAQAPEPGARPGRERKYPAREFLALDLRVAWVRTDQDGRVAGCRFERVGRPEREAILALFAELG